MVHLKTEGRGLGAVELSGSGDCFDAPVTYIMSFVFVVRVENKIHIVNTK